MRPLKWVILGMAVLAMTATFVAAQSDALRQVSYAMAAVVDRFSHGSDDAAVVQSAVDFAWTGRIADGEALEIKGVNGSISVTAAPGREVSVSAEARGRRSDPASVRIERIEHDGGITFCAVYPTREGKRENVCAPGDDGRMSTQDNDVTVDFVIEVPEGVNFIGKTVNGGVEAFGLDGDVTATTVNGDIDLATSGFAEAETVNGSIDAVVGSADLRDGASFSTVNGSITLDLADDVNADLDAQWLNGGFESDVPLTMEGRMSRRSARGVFGSGGPELELSTVNGSIRIR